MASIHGLFHILPKSIVVARGKHTAFSPFSPQKENIKTRRKFSGALPTRHINGTFAVV
jgi:hypothetical protein